MKFFLVIALFISSISFSNAQDDQRSEYEAAIAKINELEEKAQYSGDDPLIRQRLNLPPKISSFEEWIAEKNAVKNDYSEKKPEVAQAAPVVETAPVVQAQSVLTKNDNNEKKSSLYKWSQQEIKYIAITFFVLLLINFLLYCSLASYRFMFVATPFDIGSRWVLNDLENSVKWKKYFSEFSLLLLMNFSLVLFLGEWKQSPEEDIKSAIIFGVKVYVGLHVGYLLIRRMWGSSSRCPKCGTAFSASQLNSWQEPKLTYQRPHSNGSNTYEKGVQHTEFACAACGHEWQQQTQYEKQLTHNY